MTATVLMQQTYRSLGHLKPLQLQELFISSVTPIIQQINIQYLALFCI